MKHFRMFVKLFGFISLFLFFASQIAAQSDFEKFKAKRQNKFQNFREDKKEDFEKFREKRNKKFAKFLKGRWSSHEIYKPMVPTRIDPPEPVYAPEERDEDLLPVEIPVVDIVVKEEPVSVVQIPDDISISDEPFQGIEQDYASRNLNFYGTYLGYFLPKKYTFKLKGTDESCVGDAWEFFYNEGFDIILLSVKDAVDKLRLSDWGAFKLIEFISEDIYGIKSNESCILRAYLMSQINIDVRVCRTSAGLAVLVPIKEDVAEYKYLNLDGKKYYMFGNVGDGGVYTYGESFGEQANPITLAINSLPKLNDKYTESKVISSRKYPELSFKTVVNRNLMDYYNDLPPVCNISHYSSVKDADVNTILPLENLMTTALKGKTEVESVNMILDLIQYGFDYKTDAEQFGREKYNYIEENFFYPACDCEDRAVLFSVLTEGFLGLDVVLLSFPNHMSAAVCFNEPMTGDYIEYKGKKYYVCDPTYIGATAGMMMPLPDTNNVTIYDAR